MDGARVLVCCGAGGVGKTSVAAALALAAAERGRRTCVLTIDPARRLAQALGVAELGNEPRAVAGVAGHLDALVLQARQTFDDVVRASARSAEQAERILANPVYQRLSGDLAGTQEYMACEKLHELDASGRWDLLVVDTPPTRSALDLLDAPDRLTAIVDRRVRAVAAPVQLVGGLLRGLGLRAPLTGLLGQVAGSGLVAELTAFVAAFDGMHEGFRERAQRVRALFREPSTAFVVIATPDEAPLREAAFLAERLAADGLRLGTLVVNRVTRTAAVPRVRAADRRLLARGDDDARLLAALLDLHAARAALAAAERRRCAPLLASVPASAARALVPLLPGQLTDLPALRDLGAALLAGPA
ncbi:MAG TPA: ArsA-related P-loop ATPase [Actinomycetes bacterium]|nr:ArsA-related P-loop ATPase [Actinomycetes bacterium]